MTRRFLLSLMLFAATGSGVCLAGDTASPPWGPWRALEIGGVPAIAGAAAPTLDLVENGETGGSSGCNRYFGRTGIAGSAIAFGPMASTRRACLPPLMEQESRLFHVFQNSAAWRVEEGRLLLLDAKDQILARFASAVDPVGPTITISVPGAGEISTTHANYRCGERGVEVDYINADPSIALAILSLNDETIVAANVISASGARYAGGRYIWWTKGDWATLEILAGDEAGLVECRPESP